MENDSKDFPQIRRLGVIAGSGPLPFCALQETERYGLPVTVAALKEETSSEIEDFLSRLENETSLHWLGIGQLGRLIRLFKQENVDKAIMVGQVKHVRIFAPASRNPFSQLKHVPDFKMIRVLSSLDKKDTGSLIGGVISALDGEGIELLDCTLLLRRLLAGSGVLTRRSPTREEVRDFAYGRSVAKEIARLDIGQTVVVKQQAVVAVEAMEGTDETVRRAAHLVGGERLTVVKVSRPNQDMRFDLPVIGMKTLEVAGQCHVSALAVDADQTLIIEKELFIEQANEMGLTVVGFRQDEED